MRLSPSHLEPMKFEEVEVQLFKFIDLHISYKLSYVN